MAYPMYMNDTENSICISCGYLKDKTHQITYNAKHSYVL